MKHSSKDSSLPRGGLRIAGVVAMVGLMFSLSGSGCGGKDSSSGAGAAPSASGDGSNPTINVPSAAGSNSGATGGSPSTVGTMPGSVSPSPTGNTFVPGDPNAPCIPGPTQCTDCIDNDEDGLIDWQDPECTGPLDDDEGSYATGIPGDNIDFCQDCFFDGNSGHEDDQCEYHTSCLTGGTPPMRGGAGCFTCDLTEACVQNCAKFTPNGCDCFGCCSVPGTDRSVLLSSTCTSESLDDPAKCTICTQSTQCVNDCQECELCFGKSTLPESCYQSPNPGSGGSSDMPPPPAQVCSNGAQPCNAEAPCPTGFYCLTGCCIAEQVVR